MSNYNGKAHERTPLEKAEELFALLTKHELPEGVTGDGWPKKMTPYEAMGLIWFIQEHLELLPGNYERCHHCNAIYDTESGGDYCHESHEHFCGGCDKSMFECCICSNTADMDVPRKYLVINDKHGELDGWEDGIYTIKSRPYYSHPMIGQGNLETHALEFKCDLTLHIRDTGYPCAHMCKTCEKKIQ